MALVPVAAPIPARRDPRASLSTAAAILLIVLLAPVVAHAASYAITDVGPVDNTYQTEWFGVNDAGQLAGFVTIGGFAAPAIWANGVATPIFQPTATRLGKAIAISASGAVAAAVQTTNATVPAVYEADGTEHLFPGAPMTGQLASCLSMSPNGNMAATSETSAGSFIIRALPPTYMKETLPAGTCPAINDAGHVAYRLPASQSWGLWVDGTTTPIDLAPVGINNGDDIVGSTLQASAAFRPSGGPTQVLPSLPGVATSHFVDAINDARTIIGHAGTTAVIWQDGQVAALATLLPSGSGWTALTAAWALSPAGNILGEGTLNGVAHWFLLTPAGSLTASLTSDPPDPGVGSSFTLTLTVTNSTTAPLQTVTPPAVLTATGDGQATLALGPDPLSIATLAPGASTVFTYTYEAMVAGAIVFTGDVHATGPGGAVVATARCGFGVTFHYITHEAVGATCPADGNGTTVTVRACSIVFRPFVDFQGGVFYDADDVTLARLGGQQFPPRGHGYPPGAT